MKISIYENNFIKCSGRVANVHEYSKDKAANVTLYLDTGIDAQGVTKEPIQLPMKSFNKNIYNNLTAGMKVTVYGHTTINKRTRDIVDSTIRSVLTEAGLTDKIDDALDTSAAKTAKDKWDTNFETDLIIDYVMFEEAKSVVERREAMKDL